MREFEFYQKYCPYKIIIQMKPDRPAGLANGGKSMDLTPKNKAYIDSVATSPKAYEIDFEKVKTIEDIKEILKALNTTVNVVFYKSEQTKGIDHLLRVKEG